ncbi:MAG TPA: helix-turn-helix domain-containing protein, partial [Gemmataceae bacterium]|nr:helix-turn-helix domain-containing protein [Gemmataceae bacterium]
MATFAERLRELREKAGLTQQQLADASGLPVGSLRNYEQGQREPYWQVVFRLAAALGVRCEAFADCAGAELPAKGTKTRTHAPARRTPMTPKPARKTKG